MQFVFADDFIGNVGQLHFDVFVSSHGGVEIEVGYVDSHEFCVRRGDNTVEENFEKHHVGGWCADVAGKVDEVAAEDGAGAVGLLFLFSD